MEKINCHTRYVPFMSYARIPKGIRFINCAACQPVTPESIWEKVCLKKMKFLQVLLSDVPLEAWKAAAWAQW